jgi:integrase
MMNDLLGHTNPIPSTGKLWLPGMHPTDPVPRGPTSVQDYFAQTFLPEARQRGLSKDRIGEIEQAVFRWKWWCSTKYRMSSPLLGDVTAGRLSEFRREVIGTEIPGRDGKLRLVTPRSLNKTLQAIEQVIAAAIEDGTLDDSRGLLRVKKVAQPEQINKLVIPDDALTRIMKAAADANWPRQTIDGKSIDPGVMWQTAIALFVTYGMRTQDLIRYDSTMRPIRWGCIRRDALSPAEDGTLSNEPGWLTWVPNKTRRKKSFAMCLPLSTSVRYHLDRWRDAIKPGDDNEPLMPVPMTRDKIYETWKSILAIAEVRPKPKITFDDAGCAIALERGYLIKHLRCTAGTRADEHAAQIQRPDIGRWITGHISNDVFTRHYRAMEKPILETITTLPMPDGFSPETSPERPRLRIVG